MSEHTTETETTHRDGTLAVEYDVEPIEIRDPVAEALGVLAPGEPFVLTYEDVVKAAGHSCPTAAGAYRIAQLGLDALYPDGRPVRSEIEVAVAAPREDAAAGVIGRLLSYVTGAAGAGGFSGLAGGYGGRRNLLTFEAFDPEAPEPTVRFRRTDTGVTVEVRYHVGDVPDGGPALDTLRRIVDGEAAEEERRTFEEAWHGRVRHVLADDTLFTIQGPDD